MKVWATILILADLLARIEKQPTKMIAEVYSMFQKAINAGQHPDNQCLDLDRDLRISVRDLEPLADFFEPLLAP